MKDTPAALALLELLEVIAQGQNKEPVFLPSDARPTRLLSRQEAAERLGISLSTYKLLAAREKLREVRVVRRRLVAETEIERLIRDS